MRIEYECGITILYPKSKNYKLKKVNSDEETYYEVVYLGKFASPSDYEDVSIYQIEGYEEELINIKTDIDELNTTSDEQDSMIIELATEIAIIQLTL